MSRLVSNHLEYDENKLYTRLLAQFEVLGMTESIKAITFARKKHAGAIRESSGQAYIVHPLQMASIAIAMGLKDDNLIAVIILHDIVEDTETSLSDLPVNDQVKHGVNLMTTKQLDGESKSQIKVRYFMELKDDKNAIICKALDRFVNLATMAGEFSTEKIKKNVIETDQLLLPILREAKDLYPELIPTLYLLRVMIRSVNETLANAYGVELKGEQLYGGNATYVNEYQT
ncbi:HD domain-containing protein [Candidatus Saccharibacteria bacterium]|nr:HD domain-containing protein [Candidatus Saccharibacteria bacterium]